MATTWRGRGYSNSRPTYGGYSSYSAGSAYGKWGKNTASKGSYAVGKKPGSHANQPAAYKGLSHSLTWKINSFKTLFGQIQGPARFGRPTPAILNTFAKWVDKGAIIQTVSPTQISRWARNNDVNFSSRNPSVSACKNVLSAKFGRSLIKAVAKGKNGYFLVATAPIRQGRPFCFPR
jgi:hypothetical protein